MSDRLEEAARAAYATRSVSESYPWDGMSEGLREVYRAEMAAGLAAADAWDTEHGIRHVELEQAGWCDDGELVTEIPSDHDLATAYADGPPEVQQSAVGYLTDPPTPLFRIVSERKEDS